jgi:predicted RNA-binding Zn ribbon-like protein
MSKQEEAPGELEVIRAFVNTMDIERGTDALAEPPDLAAWLEAHGLAERGVRVSRAELERAVALREALRGVLLAHNTRSEVPASATEVLDATACRAKLQLRFDLSGRSRLEAGRRGADGALGRLLAIVHVAAADGTWARLKACRDHSCEWAFYDHTKNRSGAWCNMAVCGNRAKARTYRERHGATEAS